MIRFRCSACGVVLKVSDDKAGRKGRCPKCRGAMVVPPADSPPPAGPAQAPPGTAEGLLARAIDEDLKPRAASTRPCGSCHRPVDPSAAVCPHCGTLLQGGRAEQRPAAPAAAAAWDGRTCRSCRQPLPANAKICVNCGVRARSGRPVLTSRAVDPHELEARAEKVIRPLSWVVPFGLYPIYSEARGKSRPYATWAITALTIIVSLWFWAYDWTGSTEMRSMKNLMLWAGEGRPDPQRIVAFYELTEYGDREAFTAAREQLAGTVPDSELDQAAYESLEPPQQCFGQYRFSQLITHAFLHGGPLHLAGNLLFLLVLGSRVNSAIGNVGTVVLYPLLAIAAGLAHLHAAAAGEPTPMVGASGAIMGLAGMYLVLFPLQKIHVAIWFRWGLLAGFHLSRKIFSTWGVLVVLFYIAFDVLYTALQLETGVAHWAHLGGFIAGMAAAMALLAGRLVHTGGDLLSLILGRFAWPLIGRPSGRAGRGSWLVRMVGRRA